MNKKVAIVIPTFNRAGMVTRAIDTALAQTYPCQVIVCDHGSSDNTPEVIKEYGDKVIYIRKERQTPAKYPRKAGIPSKEPLK